MTIKNVVNKTKSRLKMNLKDGKKPKIRVMLYGYFANNFGDDMFFDVLFNRYPDTLFYVLFTEEYKSAFDKYNNVSYISFTGDLAVEVNRVGAQLKDIYIMEKVLLEYCDAAIHIGGSVYQQVGDVELDMKVRKQRHSCAKRFYGISNNFGPYYTEDYLSFWDEEFKKFKNVCFRDKYSYSLFKNHKSVSYAPDVLFSYKPNNTFDAKGNLAISVINTRIPVRNISDEISDAYINGIVGLIEKLVKENGFKVNVLGFCNPEEDNLAVDEIVSKLSDEVKPSVFTDNYTNDLNNTLSLINSCEYVLATRFHASVLGYVLGKKVLPVCYSNKTENMLKDIGVEEMLKLENPEDFSTENLYNKLIKTTPLDLKDFQVEADKQFSSFDRLVRRKFGKIIK